MDYEVSKGLNSLYDFINTTLTEANIHKDTARVEQAVGLVEELKTTWKEAMASGRSN